MIFLVWTFKYTVFKLKPHISPRLSTLWRWIQVQMVYPAALQLLHSFGCKANSRGFVTLPYFSTTKFYLNRLFIFFSFSCFLPISFHVSCHRCSKAQSSERPERTAGEWHEDLEVPEVKWSEARSETKKRRNEEKNSSNISTLDLKSWAFNSGAFFLAWLILIQVS